MNEEDQSDMLYFFLYFLATCFGVCFLIFSLFLCFSGRICVFIYYKVTRMPYPPEDSENTPLIVESDYFPRPGYDGYCLLGEEDPPTPIHTTGIVFTHSIAIDHASGGNKIPGSGIFPKGILTPRDTVNRIERKSRPADSLRSVSFNPRTEFQIV